MKAVIFNSGYGKRMGEFTKTHHKSQAPLKNGETIYQRQLRLLMECGIKDFVITTGPHKEQLMDAAADERFKELNFTFVENPIYDKTNYIYSMFLAKEHLDDDILLMHGDLVFDKKLLQDVIASPEKNLGMLNKQKALPEKDFKARVEDGKIVEVSINIFDENCFAFQPLYKLSKETLGKWLDRVSDFIAAGNDGVYAENALNEIARGLDIKPFGYEDYYVDEVDNLDDLERVSSDIRQFDFDEQVIYSDYNSITMLPQILKKEGSKKPMIVCDFYEFLSCREYIESLNYDFVLFKEFSPNPIYEQVAAGVKLFKEQGCDMIISIGGGSAIDTAKNIKLFAVLDEADGPFVKQEFKFSAIKHICIPGTAGTGSDSTRYSVVYYQGEKCSVTHDCIVPDYVILDPSLLETLPLFQKKCTVLDALSQCIEAIWSVNTNEKCREYALEGMRLIFKNMMPFLRNEKEALHNMQIAANLSGKAINISQTTAGHALSYKLTSLYKLPHGYSVALCLPKVWRYMNEVENARRAVEMEELGISRHRDLPIRKSILTPEPSENEDVDEVIENAVDDIRGSRSRFKPVCQMNRREILVSAFEILKKEFGMPSTNKAIKQYEFIVKEVLELEAPQLESREHLDILSDSVNPVRLGNNPEELSREAIYSIYEDVFGIKEEDDNDEEDPAPVQKKTLVKRLAEFKNRNKPAPKTWDRLKSEIKELQGYTLEILLQIDEFCKEHNITYYLSEGTLLGAVRHNGFIPWDDDVDIMMTRENYDKFINLGMQGVFPEGLALDCYENNNKHWVLAAKVQMKKPTKFVQEKTYGLTKYHGPYVDVFPLDYVPRPMSKKQLKQSKATRYVRRMLFIKTKYSLVMKAKPKRYILRAILPFIPMKCIYRYLDKNLRMFESDKNGNFKKRKYLAHLTSYYPVTKETFPTSFFGNPRYVSFMGHMLPIPCEAEFMLKTIYGKNYDTIPPFKVLKSRKHAFVIHDENGITIDDTLPDANAEDEINAYD